MRSNKRNNSFEVVIALLTSEDELTIIHIAFKLIMKNLYLQSKLKDNNIAQLYQSYVKENKLEMGIYVSIKLYSAFFLEMTVRNVDSCGSWLILV